MIIPNKLLNRGEKIGISESIKEKPGLYAMQTLVQPVSLRFKFHFEGKRQTNRLDKVRVLTKEPLLIFSIHCHSFLNQL